MMNMMKIHSNKEITVLQKLYQNDMYTEEE